MSQETNVNQIMDYITEDGIPFNKSINLLDQVNGQLEMIDGALSSTITIVKPKDSVLGLGITQTYKQNIESYNVGKNFILSTNEKFKKNTVVNEDVDYIYTDQTGKKYGFKEYFYRFNNGEKEYLTVDKFEIKISADGVLTYNGETVYSEYKSITGLKAVTEKDKFSGAKLIEQRADELKQAEEKIQNYGNAVNDFVLMNTDDGSLESFELTESRVFDGLPENKMFIPKSESLQYQALKQQYETLTAKSTSNQIVPVEADINMQLISLRSSIYELTLTLKNHIESLTLSNDNDNNKRNQILSYLNNNNIVPQDEYDLLTDAYAKYIEFKGTDIPYMGGAALKVKFRQRNLLLEQYKQLNGVYSKDITGGSLLKQKNLIEAQIGYISSKKSIYLEQLRTYYKEYVTATAKQKQLKLQLPVNYLTDGKIIKGFNEAGLLVAVYDRNENYAVIEYESYVDDSIEKNRIIRLYDNDGKQVTFTYNAENLLSQIIDIHGKKVNYTYSSGMLNTIEYDTGKKLIFNYDETDYIADITDTETKKSVGFTYDTEKYLYDIKWYSLAESIGEGETPNMPFVIDKITISKDEYLSDGRKYIRFTTNDGVSELHFLNEYGELVEWWKIENGCVADSRQYEYVPYFKNGIKQENPRKVVKREFEEYYGMDTPDLYGMVGGETDTTTLNQYNKPEKRTHYKPFTCATDTDYVMTVTDYTYDDNQQLVQEKTTVTYSSPEKTITSYKKYNYNVYGDVVRTESYADGEEYTVGKTIEETVYDDLGNVIKSFIYNSLDTSSKLYTETEYDEKGKVTAELDERGVNKTEYKYNDGTHLVNEEILPNGSKFAYGRDEDGVVTAITQSTADGEENSTQKMYKHGELIKVKSGNTEVKYTYDYKRRLTNIALNDNAEYIRIQYPEESGYNNGVNVKAVVADALGNTLTIYKDKDGKIVRKDFPNGNSIAYTYTDDGQIYSLTETETGASMVIKNYSYDELKRVVSSMALGYERLQESYTYDGCLSNPTSKTIALGISSNIPYTYNYTYTDDSLRLLDNISLTGNISGLTIKPRYDKLKRNTGKTLINSSGTEILGEDITYLKVGDHATVMPHSIRYNDNSYIKYAYDNMGNISAVYVNGKLAIRYAYDSIGKLVREDNKPLNKTCVFEYDNSGNIINKREFAFTLKNSAELEELDFVDKAYIYNGDKLLSYNGEICEYDLMGKPVKYRGKTLEWSNGKQLTHYDTHLFTYCGQGNRFTKNGLYFVYDSDNRLIRQGNGIDFIYDHTGVAGFVYNAMKYYYRKDIQGNVTALINDNGLVVASYVYDAWGNHKVYDINGVETTDVTDIGNINPFRYRSYYYDIETGLYFLKTRYYDPETGRFISPDSIEYINPETINGLNLYAYCGNNPVMNVDPNGNAFLSFLLISLGVGAFIGGTVAGVTAYNQGSRGWDLVGDILTGVGIGALIGGAVGAVLGLSIPTFGSMLGGLAFAGGSSAISLSNIEIALIGLAIVLSSFERPRNNQVQNKQYRDAARKAGFDIKDPDVLDELQNVHKYIRKNKLNLGFKELIELIKEFLG